MACGVEAHYKLAYVQETALRGEPTCRACYWRQWYRSWPYSRHVSPTEDEPDPRTPEDLQAEGMIRELKQERHRAFLKQRLERKGFELIDMPPEGEGRIVVARCMNCGRQSAARHNDVNCTCGGHNAQAGIPYAQTARNVPRPDGMFGEGTYQDGQDASLATSTSGCLDWWDGELNRPLKAKDCTKRSQRSVWWKCPRCGLSFSAPVYWMERMPMCPECTEVDKLRFSIERDELAHKTIADFPELLSAWDDERNPFETSVTVFGMCKFRCPAGHHPRINPATYLKYGCPHCRAERTKAQPQVYLRSTNPELAAEWLRCGRSGEYTPDNVKSGSRRTVTWSCIACAHEWDATVRDRELKMNNRCPNCGKVLNSLAWRYPTLAEEWAPENPTSPWNTMPYGKLSFKPKWVCRRNPEHVWEMSVASRIKKAKGCPWCG